MGQILLIEDDENLGCSLKNYLSDQGFQVTLAKNLGSAREEKSQNLEVIILDWMLPDGQGIDYLKELRSQGVKTPVIMLTARTELVDKVIGLETGANDYITKPFEPRELVARVRVQLRDGTKGTDEEVEVIQVGDLKIDCIQREVHFAGELKEFTKMEFDFLRLLASHPNRAFSREEILNKVWGYENYPSTRTVDTHVLQLRQKLDDGLIETVRGVGYRLRHKA